MIDPLKFVKSSGFIGAVKCFLPQSAQKMLFGYSMERKRKLLRKAVLEYSGGGVADFLENHGIDSPEIAGLWLEDSPENSKRRINIRGVFFPMLQGRSLTILLCPES
jgi:hypothetical protein